MLATWGAVGLLLAAVFLAGWAGSRLTLVAWRFGHRRLGYLSTFFLLFALSQALVVLETVLIVTGPPVRVRDAVGPLEPLYWLRHASLLAGLFMAVLALWAPRARPQAASGEDQAAAVAPLVPFFVLMQPLILLVQGAGLFLLVVRAAYNHVKQSDPGSLRVAFGFLLLLAGHLAPFLVFEEGPPVLGVPGFTSSLFVFLGTGVLAWSTIGRLRAKDRGGGGDEG